MYFLCALQFDLLICLNSTRSYTICNTLFVKLDFKRKFLTVKAVERWKLLPKKHWSPIHCMDNRWGEIHSVLPIL